MRINSLKTAVCAVLTALTLLAGTITAFASSGESVRNNSVPAAKNADPPEKLSTVSADAYILTEMQTGTVLLEKNADKSITSSHFNKLMTLLLLSERIRTGKIRPQDTFTVSDRANSCNDPQIWLDKGEKITVDELIKSVTVGNANDAAAVIAEGVSGSEERFVSAMNKRAEALKMSKTVFKDSTGADLSNTTTPKDIAALCSRLRKYEFLTPYFRTWLVRVRGAKAELVNSNRLVRTDHGVSGMKAFCSKQSGSCACVTAKKGGMELCAVVVGCKDNDKRDSDVRKLLECGAQMFQLYRPRIPQDLLRSISVTGGEKLECELGVENTPLVVIKRGTAPQLEAVKYREDKLEAPVAKGQICGTFTLEYDKKPVCTLNITAKENIGRMNWLCGFKKLLYNLIKL